MTPSFDLPATLRAAAVGLGILAVAGAFMCQVMTELGRVVDDRD